MLDYIRIACAVPAVKPGDVKKNISDICVFMEKADANNVDIILFPELALTGYTCGDLFYQDMLHNAVEAGLQEILACSAAHPQLTAVVGLPVRTAMGLLNAAAVISNGTIEGFTAKTYLPDYGGLNESRWFTTAEDGVEVTIADQRCWVNNETYYRIGDAKVAIEICEDLFAPISPSSFWSNRCYTNIFLSIVYIFMRIYYPHIFLFFYYIIM